MSRILRHYARHVSRYPQNWLPILVLVPLGTLLASFVPAYVAARIIDRLAEGSVPLSQVWSVFGVEILAFALSLVLGELVLWRVADALLWDLEAKVVQRLYADCFRHLNGQSMPFFGDRFVGSMVSAVNKFTGAYILAADTMTFVVLPLVTAVVVTVAVLAPVVPAFAAGVVVLTAALVVINVVTYRPLARLTQRHAETYTAIGGRLADVLSNVLVVKSYGREEDEDDDFRGYTTDHRHVTIRAMRGHVGRDLGIGSVLVVLLLLALAAILVAQASAASTATLVVLLTFSLALFGYLWELPRVLRTYNRVYGDATPMTELLAVPPAVTDPVRPEPVRITAGHVRLDRVSFTYPDAGRPVFEDLTLDITPGERVGLVGPSGSGKTSVTRLVLRFFDPQSGAVTVDGQDVRRVAQQDLRSRIAFVPQEPLLFHRSIAENIRYGRPDAPEADVLAAAERAQVTEFVADLPDGLATLVGERGVKLSGGQRQRIAIARAILSRAPVMILDEATSALDSLSEARIQTALEEAMAGRTTIAIAHRLSTLRSMTRLVVLDRGRLVEDGDHGTLLSRDGVYAAMWTQQSGGFVAV